MSSIWDLVTVSGKFVPTKQVSDSIYRAAYYLYKIVNNSDYELAYMTVTDRGPSGLYNVVSPRKNPRSPSVIIGSDCGQSINTVRSLLLNVTIDGKDLYHQANIDYKHETI